MKLKIISIFIFTLLNYTVSSYANEEIDSITDEEIDSITDEEINSITDEEINSIETLYDDSLDIDILTEENETTLLDEITPNNDDQISSENDIQENTAVEEEVTIDISGIKDEIDKHYNNLLKHSPSNVNLDTINSDPDNYVIIYLDTNDSVLIKLKPEIAPNTVARFKKLIEEDFYVNMDFFKAIPNYIVQTGDPSGSGYGGKGVFYFAEINENEKFKRGTVAMANRGNTQSDDTQFFITFNSFEWLDGKYTIFGEVVAGIEALEKVNSSFDNNGFVENPSKVKKIEFVSERQQTYWDNLSSIFPYEKPIKESVNTSITNEESDVEENNDASNQDNIVENEATNNEESDVDNEDTENEEGLVEGEVNSLSN